MKKLLTLLAVCAVVLVGCSVLLSTSATNTPVGLPRETVAPSGDAKLTYSVEGAGKATVTYSTTSGSTQKDVTLPFRVDDVDASYGSVIATRTSGKGEIQCVITRGDIELARTSADGQFASCSANTELFE